MISKALLIAGLFLLLAAPSAWGRSFMSAPLALGAPYLNDSSRGLIDQEGDDESSSFSDTDELALSQQERRATYQQGVALSLGVVLPWQEIGVSYHRIADDRTTWVYSVGSGTFRMTGFHDTREYVLETSVQNVSWAWRYYFTELFPVFLQPSLSLAAWQGDISPKGADPAMDTAAARLDSGFSAMGAIAGLNLGILWLWDNHFFIEYSVFRLGKAQLFTSHFSNDYSESKTAARKDLQRLLSWGFANLTLGWYF